MTMADMHGGASQACLNAALHVTGGCPIPRVCAARGRGSGPPSSPPSISIYESLNHHPTHGRPAVSPSSLPPARAPRCVRPPAVPQGHKAAMTRHVWEDAKTKHPGATLAELSVLMEKTSLEEEVKSER